jgi:uncharacterized protein YecE (DUF72 family)
MRPNPRTEQFGLFAGFPGLRRPTPVEPAPPDPAISKLADALPATLRLGTSSWSFPGWRGLIYAGRPDQSRLANQGLPAYSAYPLFRAVGVDRTFYRPMTEEQFAVFAAQVPDDFRFVVKAHQVITRLYDLDRQGNPIGPNPTFLDAAYAAENVIGPTVQGLGEKCGIILFQFSPTRFDKSYTPARVVDWIGRFLGSLPKGPQYAVELRNGELLSKTYTAALNESGACHCFNVHPTMPRLEDQASVVGERTGPVTLCRWLMNGRFSYEDAGKRYEPFTELKDEDPVNRASVAGLAARAVAAGRPTYVIADNKAEGSAPRTLAKLAKAVLVRLGA